MERFFERGAEFEADVWIADGSEGSPATPAWSFAARWRIPL